MQDIFIKPHQRLQSCTCLFNSHMQFIMPPFFCQSYLSLAMAQLGTKVIRAPLLVFSISFPEEKKINPRFFMPGCFHWFLHKSVWIIISLNKTWCLHSEVIHIILIWYKEGDLGLRSMFIVCFLEALFDQIKSKNISNCSWNIGAIFETLICLFKGEVNILWVRVGVCRCEVGGQMQADIC